MRQHRGTHIISWQGQTGNYLKHSTRGEIETQSGSYCGCFLHKSTKSGKTKNKDKVVRDVHSGVILAGNSKRLACIFSSCRTNTDSSNAGCQAALSFYSPVNVPLSRAHRRLTSLSAVLGDGQGHQNWG